MEKKVIQILLMICLVLTVIFGGCARSETSSPPEKPAPQTLLDSDGDGMSDWFEKNIAKTDPLVPNRRYIVLYNSHPEEGFDIIVKEQANWLSTKAGIPSENIIALSKEKANERCLREAIEWIATKANENDIVFLSLSGHGGKTGIAYYWVEGMDRNYWLEEGMEPPAGPLGFYSGPLYTDIDQWLDRIKARMVIVTIMACESFYALAVLKEGTSPRIVYVNTGREFVGALGEDLEYAITADTRCGNGDGYVSLGEIGKWLDNDPKWRLDWEEVIEDPAHRFVRESLEEQKRIFEANGHSRWVDPAGIADQIYLTDYKNPKLVR